MALAKVMHLLVVIQQILLNLLRNYVLGSQINVYMKMIYACKWIAHILQIKPNVKNGTKPISQMKREVCIYAHG